MSWHVYVIYSESANVYYKGETQNFIKRIAEHNKNLSRYTSGKGHWKLIFIEELPNRTEALKREKQLKRQNRKYIEWLIKQPINKLIQLSPKK